MAIVMSMHWPEVSKEQYEAVRREVNWEGVIPQGAKFHTAWLSSDGFRVVDLWDSEADFHEFAQHRLTPGVQKAGISGQPKVEMAPALSVFAPNLR